MRSARSTELLTRQVAEIVMRIFAIDIVIQCTYMLKAHCLCEDLLFLFCISMLIVVFIGVH